MGWQTRRDIALEGMRQQGATRREMMSQHGESQRQKITESGLSSRGAADNTNRLQTNTADNAAKISTNAYTADQGLAGDRLRAKATVDSSKYTADQGLAGDKYKSDASFGASKYTADQGLAGDKYRTDGSVAANKYGADIGLTAAKYGDDSRAKTAGNALAEEVRKAGIAERGAFTSNADGPVGVGEGGAAAEASASNAYNLHQQLAQAKTPLDVQNIMEQNIGSSLEASMKGMDADKRGEFLNAGSYPPAYAKEAEAWAAKKKLADDAAEKKRNDDIMSRTRLRQSQPATPLLIQKYAS